MKRIFQRRIRRIRMMIGPVSHEDKHFSGFQSHLRHYCMDGFLIIIHTAQKRLPYPDLPEQGHVFHQIFHHPVILNPVDNMRGLDDHLTDPVRRHTSECLLNGIDLHVFRPFQLAHDHPARKRPVYAPFRELPRDILLDHRDRLFHCI